MKISYDDDFDNDGLCNTAKSARDPVTGQVCTPNAAGLGDNCVAVPNPDQADANHNGVGDVCEPNVSLNDGDNDDLPDNLERSVFGTDPTKTDTDGDSLSDGDEIKSGLNPLKADGDGDGFCDGNATVSDAQGKFRIENVPEGSYTLEVWHEQFGEQKLPVAVTTGKNTTVSLRYGKQ